MSEEIHVKEHSSPVKTPKQLIVVVVLAFAVPIILIVLLAHLATLSIDSSAEAAAMSPEAIAKRLKPVGEVAMLSKEEREARASAQKTAAPTPKPEAVAKAAAKAGAFSAQPAQADASKGKYVYDSVCAACHAAGVAGAPKFGDKAAWAPRIQSGIESLHTSALKGKNAMPPKGGNPTLPDGDVKAAVDYMVSHAK
jgi:cytochrome c5